MAVVSEPVQVTREIRDLELRQTFPRPETHSLGMGELHHGAAHTDGYDQGYCLFQHGITRLFLCLQIRAHVGASRVLTLAVEGIFHILKFC